MSELVADERFQGGVKVLSAALVGVVAGLIGTAVALGSIEFAVFGAVGGAVASAITALSRIEFAEA